MANATVITQEKKEKLINELSTRELSALEIIQIAGVKRSSITNVLALLSTATTLYSPHRGFYKIITKADYDAYEKEHATKLEDLLK